MSSGKDKENKLGDILRRRPQFINNTPLDIFFKELEEELIKKLDEFDGPNIYLSVSCKDNTEFVEKCLDYFKRLQLILKEKEKTDNKNNKDLIPISLHDFEHFDILVNLMVVHGIYAHLPPGVGVPFEQRQLSNFKQTRVAYKIPDSCRKNTQTLRNVLDHFYVTFMNGDDTSTYVQKILLKGIGYMDTLTGYIALLHGCDSSDANSEIQMLVNLESVQETYELFSIYSVLVQGTSSAKYKEWPLTRLSTLPVRRNDGVRSLVDFVIGVREDHHVNMEKSNRLNQILLSKPKTMTYIEYFKMLFLQIYDGLASINNPVLVNCLNNVITAFYFKNKRIIEDFLFRKINSILFNPNCEDYSAKQLNDVINVLISLSKNTSTEVVTALVRSYDAKQFYLNLWIYSMFLRKNQTIQPGDTKEPYFNVILNLIKTFIRVCCDQAMLEHIMRNLVNHEHDTWEYRLNMETHLPYIARKADMLPSNGLKLVMDHDDKKKKLQQLFLDIDFAIDAFIQFIKTCDGPDLSISLLLKVINDWVRSNSVNKYTQPLMEHGQDEMTHNLLSLIDLKLLENMSEAFKYDLVKRPHGFLLLIKELLEYTIAQENPDDSDDEDIGDDDSMEGLHVSPRPLSILLELLGTILQSTSPKVLSKSQTTLTEIEVILRKLPSNSHYISLDKKISELTAHSNSDVAADTSIERDQEMLDKAISYIHDQSVPIKAHGLQQLRKLLEKNSPVIKPRAVLELHMQQLPDPEPFIYLNVIKSLTSICQSIPDKAVPFLLSVYRDAEAPYKLDTVLKVGEVFVNYVSTQGELFRGTYAIQIIQSCLTLVRERERFENRVRMSAMSLLGLILQVNARGVREQIGDLMDCAFGILQFERPTEVNDKTSANDDSNLMRRAAVLLIYDLIYNSGVELVPAQYNGTKLKLLLEHTRANEPDYLVCEHLDNLMTVLNDYHRHLLSPEDK